MTKQEEIKEMAKEIFNSGIAIEAIDLVYGLIDNDDHFHRLAKYLYSAGYRKVPKDSVVLSREECEQRAYNDLLIDFDERHINKLLVDFDEKGFAPTTLCENPEAEAIEWKKRLIREIKRLYNRIDELKQDLVHADEKVFYREQNVRLHEEEIKTEARKETAKEILDLIAKIMIEQFGDEPPCNFNDNDDYMYENCEEFCCEYCNTPDNEKNYERCWVEFFKSKMKKYGVEVEE